MSAITHDHSSEDTAGARVTRKPARGYIPAIALLLVAACSVFALGTPTTTTPALPAPSRLVATSGWSVDGVDTQAMWQGTRYAQWILVRPGAAPAYLYVERTAAVQTMLRWSGELGYVGAGYSVDRRSIVRMALADSRPVSAALVIVRNLSDRRVVLSVAMRTGTILAHGGDRLPARSGA